MISGPPYHQAVSGSGVACRRYCGRGDRCELCISLLARATLRVFRSSLMSDSTQIEAHRMKPINQTMVRLVGSVPLESRTAELLVRIVAEGQVIDPRYRMNPPENPRRLGP